MSGGERAPDAHPSAHPAAHPAAPADVHGRAPQSASFGLSRGIVLGILGVIIGTWSTLCGIGGGIFAVPILHYIYRLPLKTAVGNSLVMVAASTTAATVFEVARSDTALNVQVLAMIVPFSLLGAHLGYRAARKIDALRLKIIFCVLLVIVGADVFFGWHGAQGAITNAAGLALSARELVSVAVIGVAAGFVAPILGIGGGLVAVPALMFGVPALGFASARACSTAMSLFNTWQSVWLYRKDGHVMVPLVVWLAGGALAGGWLGVRLVHVSSILPLAESLLGVTLLLVAARFAWDVWFEVRRRP